MQCVRPLLETVLAMLCLPAQFLWSALQSRTSLIAENLFPRKQLAFYQEHKVKPRPSTDVTRLTLVLWSRLFDWRNGLVVVKPDTLIGWHRKGFTLFWRWKSRPGRPPLKREIRELIVRMARENPTCNIDNSNNEETNTNVDQVTAYLEHGRCAGWASHDSGGGRARWHAA